MFMARPNGFHERMLRWRYGRGTTPGRSKSVRGFELERKVRVDSDTPTPVVGHDNGPMSTGQVRLGTCCRRRIVIGWPVAVQNVRENGQLTPAAKSRRPRTQIEPTGCPRNDPNFTRPRVSIDTYRGHMQATVKVLNDGGKKSFQSIR